MTLSSQDNNSDPTSNPNLTAADVLALFSDEERNAAIKLQYPPLAMSIGRGDSSLWLTQLLVERFHESVNGRSTSRSISMLGLAIENNAVEHVRYLLGQGAMIDVSIGAREHHVELALCKKNTEVMRLLLQHYKEQSTRTPWSEVFADWFFTALISSNHEIAPLFVEILGPLPDRVSLTGFMEFAAGRGTNWYDHGHSLLPKVVQVDEGAVLKGLEYFLSLQPSLDSCLREIHTEYQDSGYEYLNAYQIALQRAWYRAAAAIYSYLENNYQVKAKRAGFRTYLRNAPARLRKRWFDAT